MPIKLTESAVVGLAGETETVEVVEVWARAARAEADTKSQRARRDLLRSKVHGQSYFIYEAWTRGIDECGRHTIHRPLDTGGIKITRIPHPVAHCRLLPDLDLRF